MIILFLSRVIVYVQKSAKTSTKFTGNYRSIILFYSRVNCALIIMEEILIIDGKPTKVRRVQLIKKELVLSQPKSGLVVTREDLKRKYAEGDVNETQLVHENKTIQNIAAKPSTSFVKIENSTKAAKRTKFIENKIEPGTAAKFDEAIKPRVKPDVKQQKPLSELSDRQILLQNNQLLRKIRLEQVMIKNFLFGQKGREKDEYANMLSQFPFILPLANVADLSACEEFIASPDNEEKLVSYSIFVLFFIDSYIFALNL